ncbi:hypothetical protein GGQ97_000939 [Sphingomonas kaistensis]|uniref:Outer membrane protein beta-barrel domain-containing protein n=1 Tax=Sphingomonas kaistensis TaxID=298708 RepID=A0A7X5Y4W0_9SPHN|nr:hypothetical protein [Sphingomonas kaistensis]NJC05146.1 hypothetical protein [Sphingomonas kaistensis]
MRHVLVAACAVAFVASPALAQTRSSAASVGVTGGTLGIGPEIGWRSTNFGVRGSATLFSLSRGVDSDGIEYDGDLKLRSFGGSLDFYPGGGGFRLSGGVRAGKNRVELTATPAATTSVEVGDVTYTGAQIGTLSGEVRARKVAPTLTLGYGGGVGSGVYFGIDAGAMFQGKPKVRSLTATGPISTNAAFQTQLANERREIEEDIDNFKVYPILQLGLGYRF